MTPEPRAAEALEQLRARRLRAPLLAALWTLLAVEGVGGLVIFAARLAAGATPGETLHVVAGLLLTFVFIAYQWQHWMRVKPYRAQLHYILGVLSTAFMALTLLTGLALSAYWWRDRVASHAHGPAAYPPVLSGIHNIGSMLVLTFVGAHLAAVLMRDRTLLR